MNCDKLYLLKPDFMDGSKGPYFCPGCAEVVGLMEYYPALKHLLDVHYINYSRPRTELVSLLGEENQSCPVMVLTEIKPNLTGHLKVQQANGHSFVEGPRAIAEYLAHVHKIGIPK